MLDLAWHEIKYTIIISVSSENDRCAGEEESVIRRLFGVYIENKFTCKCSESSVRETCCSLIDLTYPDTTASSRSHVTSRSYLQCRPHLVCRIPHIKSTVCFKKMSA